MFTISTSTDDDVLAQLSSQLGDPGTLQVLAVIVAIPLVFYVIRRLKGLFPSS